MYTALVSPHYAERHGHATTLAGGFVAHGLVPPHREGGERAEWFYALLPGGPEQANPEHVKPFPAERVEAVLGAERDRYLDMARIDGDSVWGDAAETISEMIQCLRRNALQETPQRDAEFSHES